MYNCPKCGAPLEGDVNFCPNCQSDIKQANNTIPDVEKSNEVSDDVQIFEKVPFSDRFFAWLIDRGICFVLMFPLGFVAFDFPYGGELSIWVYLTGILYLTGVVYNLLKDGLGKGQSIGKRIMGLKVIKLEDYANCSMDESTLRVTKVMSCSPCTKLLSFVRVLITAVLALFCIGIIIEVVMVLATDDGRRLADRVAGTMVVVDDD